MGVGGGVLFLSRSRERILLISKLLSQTVTFLSSHLSQSMIMFHHDHRSKMHHYHHSDWLLQTLSVCVCLCSAFTAYISVDTIQILIKLSRNVEM